MHKRKAKTKTEIDMLPPFGEPEVVTTGNGAVDVALAGVAAVGTVSYLANK